MDTRIARTALGSFGITVLLGLAVLTAPAPAGAAPDGQFDEQTTCRACLLPDTDGDGLDYADEVAYGTNPNAFDTDGDRLSDGAEVADWEADPLDRDTDDDGLLDGLEVELGTYLGDSDTDGDRLSDGDEVYDYATNPLNYDTDYDGYTDYDELFVYRTLPQIASSHP